MKQLEQDVLAVMLGEALHPNQQKIDVVDDEKIDGKDFAKLRAMKNKKTGKIHNCAVHVEHPEYGMGECISEAHADPDEDGNIAWYTVKFEDSTQVVNSSDIKIIASESHMHNEEAEQIDELSPSTLMSYRHKARNSELRSAETARRDTEMSQQTTNPTVKAKSAAYAAQAHAKAEKRRAGQLKATSRLSNEEVEQTNEAQTSAAARYAKAKMSHQAKTTMKHIKPGTLKQNYGDKLDAANIKPGIKGVADRIAMLDRAKKEGRLKEEVGTELEEAKGLASMTMDQLKQEHDRIKNKINDMGKSRMISMNHPLSQRARSIRLHMAIKKKQANEEVKQTDESFAEKTKYSIEKAHKHPDGAVTVKVNWSQKQNGEMKTGSQVHSGSPSHIKKVLKTRYNLSHHLAEENHISEMDKSMAYATGTKRAMQMTGDKPPLEKSTIKKAHKIAKAMLRKEEVEDQFADYDEVIESKPLEFELQDSYNFGDYLSASKKIVGEELAIELANYAYNKQDTDLFLEMMSRDEVESRVKSHMNAGHQVSTPKYSTRDGKFHAEFVVKDKESGVRRKYIYHGNTRKVENMGTPGKRD